MDLYVAYAITLAITVLSSSVLGIWLIARTRREGPIRLLAFFCFGVATWNAGHLVIALGFAEYARLGRALINLSFLNPALFVHFSARLAFGNLSRTTQVIVGFSYAASALLAGWMVVTEAGRLDPWLSFPMYYQLDTTGWPLAVAAFFVSGLAYLFLAVGWLRAESVRRRQIIWVLWTGVWGLICASGFITGSLDTNLFPYSMLLLPTYNILLVYGILRYEMTEVNRWANRVLAVAIVFVISITLVSLGVALSSQFGFADFTTIPLWQIWLVAAASIVVASIVRGPLRQLAEQLIYPGARLDNDSIRGWRQRLENTESQEELIAVAEHIIYEAIREPVTVCYGEPPTDNATVSLRQAHGGSWQAELHHWRTAAPGIRRQITVINSLIATSATQLEQKLRLVEEERRRLAEAHLTELGGLTAAIAHELRNPLNIISMISSQCDEQVKSDIRTQVNRADRLVQDILSYAGQIKIQAAPVNIHMLLPMIIAKYPGQTVTSDIQAATIFADPFRLEQILTNVFDNAFAMQRGQADGVVHLQTLPGLDGILLRIYDNGPGIPADVRETIFHAFKSNRRGGHGLGLAIVRRLVEAHGGTVKLLNQTPGWSTGFEIFLPNKPSAQPQTHEHIS